MFDIKLHNSGLKSPWRPTSQIAATILCVSSVAMAGSVDRPISPTNIFAPDSTPAHSIYRLSLLVLEIAGVIFVIVFSLLLYAAIKFRRSKHDGDPDSEPPQMYGSNQIELAWIVVPTIIVLVLFLSSAQVLRRVQGARLPNQAIEVTIVGHQYWWEYRYAQFGFATSNELHVPVSNPQSSTPMLRAW